MSSQGGFANSRGEQRIGEPDRHALRNIVLQDATLIFDPAISLVASPVLNQLPATSCEMVIAMAQLAFAVTCSFT